MNLSRNLWVLALLRPLSLTVESRDVPSVSRFVHHQIIACMLSRGLCNAGYPEYELTAGGSELVVDKHNVGKYIQAVVDATLHEGIKAQMQAFRCWPFPGTLLRKGIEDLHQASTVTEHQGCFSCCPKAQLYWMAMIVDGSCCASR